MTAKEVSEDLVPGLAELPVLVQSHQEVDQVRDRAQVQPVPNPVVAVDPQVRENLVQDLVSHVPEVVRALGPVLVAEVLLQKDQIVVHGSPVVEVEAPQLRPKEVDQINQNHVRAPNRDQDPEAEVEAEAVEVARIPEVEVEVARQCRGNLFREARNLAVVRMTSRFLLNSLF